MHVCECVCVCLSVCILQGTVVDMRGQAMLDLPEGNPQPGPVYNGEPQVLGPGFAPFKPYLRPKFFHLKVSAGGACCVCTTALVFVIGDVLAALERSMSPLCMRMLHLYLSSSVLRTLQLTGFLSFTIVSLVMFSCFILTIPGMYVCMYVWRAALLLVYCLSAAMATTLHLYGI